MPNGSPIIKSTIAPPKLAHEKDARYKTARPKRWLFGGLTVAVLVATIASFGKQEQSQQSSPQQAQQPTPTAPASAPAPQASTSSIEAGNSSGFVRTSDDAPIPGATVRLTNTETNQAWASWTDSTGKFEFPLLPAGHYRVEATQLGFQSASIEAQLPAPASNPVAVVLRVATLAQLNAPSGSGGANRQRGAGGRGGFGGRGGAA
jgi:Carboxypeptidase regulatory-like domain